MDRIIFRKWKHNGSIIAILPNNPSNQGFVDMYEHIGQHGEGNYQAVLLQTVPAKPEEYQDLLAELKQIGYRPKIVKRLRAGKYEASW
jgi:hypothetical protein